MNYGYFDDPKKEYVITDMFPPRPWTNYLWNEQYIINIDQFGFGSAVLCDDECRKRDIMVEDDNRHVYILDRKTGEFYSANRNYKNLPFSCRETHVGQGYTRIVSEYDGVKTEITIFVPIQGMMECWEIKLTNTGKEKRELSVYPYAHIHSLITGHQAYVRGEWKDDLNGVYVTENGYLEPTNYVQEYLAAEEKPVAFETTNRFFTGVYGNTIEPDALKKGGKLSCQNTCFEPENGVALQFDLDLNPGEEKIYRVALGTCKTLEQAKSETVRVLNAKGFAENLAELKKRADVYDDKISIHTGDVEIDRRVNIWLKRQIELGKTWARVYTRGSRDIMQDITSFVGLAPEVSREKLIDAMKYVRANGNIIRAWMPLNNTKSHDCSSWMITAVCQYIKETSDYSILDEDCPYYESDERGTVLDHLLRAAHFLLDGVGQHGLTLWGECDWNDSLNACGIRGKGESAWLAEASVKCGRELVELLHRLGNHEKAEEINAKADKMKENILKYAWEKDHFIYGYNDFNEKIGSYECKEGRTYLNPQTWAVLSDMLDEKGCNELMDYVERELSCKFGYVQQKPSYSVGTDHIGRVSYMQKGCYENGSVYNHGCTFKIAADCRLHRGNEALHSVHMMLPTNPDNDCSVSGVEPYAITNMYLGPENEFRVGAAVMGWVTGTSGWLFRGIVEFMLGIQAEYDGLAIRPALPEVWKQVTVHRTYRNAVYDITLIQNAYNGKISLTVDGKAIDGDIVPAFEDGKTHTVVATIG